MQDGLIGHAPEQLAIVGPLWLYALTFSGVSMVFESARPRSFEGEQDTESAFVRNVAMISSLLSPFLLLVHAYWAVVQAGRFDALLAVFGAVFGVVIVASAIGMAIGAGAPGLGRALRRFSAYVAVASLAFTIWVTWANAYAVINAYLLSHPR